ncbi:hypothetical protein [Mycolicibacterium brumae]|uniref:aromatic-ring hydroxylase C-terminal domain-containing protein n=1 Tax=Mycolicibacterium brumae TaxID=85968 RepID=UPI000A890DD4|nr:hypothetical protein [Mycolicibacterium brumae]MCV7194237.1 hypothetical protein [Mycolicibacterium brumae]UWW10424.1 hypothetical protein L2Z93_003554 [Mycolicibacterium brumae]
MRRRVAPRVLRLAHTQRVLTRAISQLDVSYHDGSGAAPHGRVAVGDRAPDLTVGAATGWSVRLHDLLDDDGYTLLVFADIDADDLCERVQVARIPDPAAAAAYGLPDGGVALVRPDGYLAYLGAELDREALAGQLFAGDARICR